MDIFSVFGPVIKSFWWVIPLLIVLSIIKTAWFKGKLGEFFVNTINKIWLPSDKYHCLKNITLPTKDDSTTQIDHVIISTFGVFVIETKNMTGWIFGTKNEANWVQKLHKKSFKFQNPLRQNYRHVKAVEDITGIPIEHIHSVVSFMGQAKIKTEVPANVTQGTDYIKYIRSFDTPVLTEEQVGFAVNQIQSHRLKNGFSTNRQHVRNLKERHQQPR